MYLRERYTQKTKNKTIRLLSVFVASLCLSNFGSSLAKYELDTSGFISVTIAKWNVSLNGETLTGRDEISNCIMLIPTENYDPDNPYMPKPGTKGYFEVELNPAGTEVSFEYKLTFDSTNFPTGFSVAPNSAATGSFNLGNKNIFTSSDAKTIKFDWTWVNGIYPAAIYKVAVIVELKQIV